MRWRSSWHQLPAPHSSTCWHDADNPLRPPLTHAAHLPTNGVFGAHVHSPLACPPPARSPEEGAPLPSARDLRLAHLHKFDGLFRRMCRSLAGRWPEVILHHFSGLWKRRGRHARRLRCSAFGRGHVGRPSRAYLVKVRRLNIVMRSIPKSCQLKERCRERACNRFLKQN